MLPLVIKQLVVPVPASFLPSGSPKIRPSVPNETTTIILSCLGEVTGRPESSSTGTLVLLAERVRGVRLGFKRRPVTSDSSTASVQQHGASETISVPSLANWSVPSKSAPQSTWIQICSSAGHLERLEAFETAGAGDTKTSSAYKTKLPSPLDDSTAKRVESTSTLLPWIQPPHSLLSCCEFLDTHTFRSFSSFFNFHFPVLSTSYLPSCFSNLNL